MKNDNTNADNKVVLFLGLSNVVLIVGSILMIFLFAMNIYASFDESIVNSFVYSFFEPFLLVAALGCPLLLLLSIYLVYYNIAILPRKGVFDRKFTSTNLRFQLIIMLTYIVLLSVFYFLPSNYFTQNGVYYDRGVEEHERGCYGNGISVTCYD